MVPTRAKIVDRAAASLPPRSGEGLETARLRDDDEAEDQQVDEARHEPADEEGPPAAQNSLEYPAHAPPQQHPAKP